LDAALRALIFEPLGAPAAFIATAPEDLDRTVWGNKQHYHPGWVYHGLAIGPPSTSAHILDRLLYGPLLSGRLQDQLLTTVSLGRRFAGRPAVAPGYGLGLMIDSQSSLGRMIGHTGQGPGSTVAVYSFPDLAQPRTVSVFAPSDSPDAQGALENHILALASETQLGAIIDPTEHP
jgi:D-alanyl-D-alanine carboxypeptidase